MKRNETTVSNGFLRVTRMPSKEMPKFANLKEEKNRNALLEIVKRRRGLIKAPPEPQPTQ